MNSEETKTIVKLLQYIEFTCHSDDLFSVSVCLIDELNMDAKEDTKTRDRYCFHLSQEDKELKVVAHYSYKGIWSIDIEPVEGKPIPTWDMKFKTGSNDYSPSLTMTVPIDTVITSGDNRLEFRDEVIDYFQSMKERDEELNQRIKESS